jgi:hypothetical protein
VISTNIQEGFEHENLIEILSDTETVGEFDRVTLSELRGLRAFWIARGGYIEASTLRRDTMEIEQDMIGFHLVMNEDQVRSNFVQSAQDVIAAGIQRMDAEINLRLLSIFQEAIPVGSPSYVSGAGLSLPALNAAIRAVQDVSKSQEVTIVGRSSMTGQIMDELANTASPAFLQETNEEIMRRGVLGVYRGARIVTLRNFQDDEDISFFPANELYVVARDASKFAFFGGLSSKETTEGDNWYWHYLGRRAVGGVVHRSDRIRRIVDTSIPA